MNLSNSEGGSDDSSLSVPLSATSSRSLSAACASGGAEHVEHALRLQRGVGVGELAGKSSDQRLVPLLLDGEGHRLELFREWRNLRHRGHHRARIDRGQHQTLVKLLRKRKLVLPLRLERELPVAVDVEHQQVGIDQDNVRLRLSRHLQSGFAAELGRGTFLLEGFENPTGAAIGGTDHDTTFLHFSGELAKAEILRLKIRRFQPDLRHLLFQFPAIRILRNHLNDLVGQRMRLELDAIHADHQIGSFRNILRERLIPAPRHQQAERRGSSTTDPGQQLHHILPC